MTLPDTAQSSLIILVPCRVTWDSRLIVLLSAPELGSVLISFGENYVLRTKVGNSLFSAPFFLFLIFFSF